MKTKILLIFITLLISVNLIYSQDANFEDNEYYQKAQELLEMAKEEENKGEYDKAYELSEQAKEYLKKANEYNQLMAFKQNVDNKKILAEETLAKAKEKGADTNTDSTPIYNEALTFYNNGNTSYSEADTKEEFTDKRTSYEDALKNYEDSINKSNESIMAMTKKQEDAEKLLAEAKKKRNYMLDNNLISNNDTDDSKIQTEINDSENLYNSKQYEDSKNKSENIIAYMDDLIDQKEAEKLLMTAKDKHNKLLDDKTINKNDEDDSSIVTFINDSENNLNEKKYTESKDKSKEAIVYMDVLINQKEAEKLLKQASEDLDTAKSNGSEKDFPDETKKADDLLVNANETYDSKEYDNSISYSKQVIDIVDKFGYEDFVLPKYYKVRLNRRKRDCLWRIAGFSFVYNNPWKWKVLYNANKEILLQPNNPDLIEIDQVIEIPSISGEKRSGTYDPDKEYPEYKE